eukprot:TRINITY_DN7173_c0_g3_i2.p1 TRINITY_DN7173_c0_g3~~TRINITY_DN7173_c0_g3_i2.p1  ORF type:complete len:531 (+),score=173.52 TRINITY_DN7173_c0_g3_i2:222-1595(+)
MAENFISSEMQKCQNVHENISKLLKEHQQKIHDHYPKFWPVIRPLFDHLSEFSEDLKGDKEINMVLLGYGFEGKTSILNGLAQREEGPTGRRGAIGTDSLEWRMLERANVCVLDTMGDATQDKNLRNQLSKLLEAKKSDLIVCVLSPHTMGITDALKKLSETVKEIRTVVKKRFGCEIPVIFVFNKVDTFNEWKRSKFDGSWKQYSEFLDRNEYEISKEIAEVLEERFPIYSQIPSGERILVLTSCENFEPNRNYGMLQLSSAINIKLYNKILDNKVASFQAYRLASAHKIIAAFGSASAAVGAIPIPGLDIVGIYYLTEMMLEILSCLAVNPNRNVNKFKNSSKWIFGALTAIRTAGVLASIPLEFSGIALPLGVALGAASGGGITASIGWHAYNWFTTEKLSEEEKKEEELENFRKEMECVLNDERRNSQVVEEPLLPPQEEKKSIRGSVDIPDE